jgi:death-on-curing protein
VIRGFLASEPRFLSTDEVLTLHETAIDAFGGSHGVRDAGLLDAALAMPRQSLGGQFVHDFPFGMAAAYLFHICGNHPFIDGNKRVALAACIAFLRINGWNLAASEDATVTTILEIARSAKTKEEAGDWLQANSRGRVSIELREFFQRLDYATLATVFGAINAGQTSERVATILEAGTSIPAIAQANLGAVAAQQGGDLSSAEILRQHSMLLTAIYRIAEDMGYEW